MNTVLGKNAFALCASCCLVCPCILAGSNGGNVERIKIDSGILYYCTVLPTTGIAYEVYHVDAISNLERSSTRISFFDGSFPPMSIWLETPNPLYGSFRKNDSRVRLFPFSWDVAGKHMGIITPRLYRDALGRIFFDMVIADDALPIMGQVQGRPPSSQHETSKASPYPVLVCPHVSLRGFASTTGCVSDLVKENHKVLWFEMCDSFVLARLPLKHERMSNAWDLCENPKGFQWAEYGISFECSRLSVIDLNMLMSCWVDSVDDFSPVGAARVAGRRVLSDSEEARFPKDADWLIWEKSPEASRLCKMAKGKWATCPEMPVQKPPRLIVTDDDNGIVLLVYSFGIDQADVEGSLRKVAKMLEDRGFPLKPRPDKPVDAAAASASGAPGNEALKAASPSTNAVAVASVPMRSETNQVAAATPPAPKPAIMLRGTNHVAQAKASDDAAAAAKAFAEYGIKPEENAKRGAMMFERPETRDEGLRLLRESARNGSPFALARLSALYYTGDGGVKRDYAKAIKLMEAAASRGFPRFLLPLKEARKAMQREEDLKKKDKPGLWPGLGYPGAIVPYRANRTLQKMLDRYSLTAGVFRRDPIGDAMLPGPDSRKYLLTEEIPYLLFTPKSGSAPVPLVMYFGGTGEQGTDLSAHFRQKTIFDMVCSPEFQKRRPCYLFAPMVPKESNLFCSRRSRPPMAALVCDAMYAVIKNAKSPSVDTNRLYLTGLSWGGSVAYTMPFGYPGRFAASVPVAGYATADCVPDHSPGNFWLLFNEHEYADKGDRARLDEMIRTVTSRGGEFRVSSFPDRGHNSWDKAWREERVWDWMFSKTADGRSVRSSAVAGGVGGVSRAMRGARCTASKPGRDARTGPERAADGLDSTCYVSKTPFKSGDWWQIEFAEPVSGRVVVKCGYADGRGRARSAHVETSTGGSTWTRRGGFSRASGECRFPLSSPVRSIRVVSSSKAGEIMVVREVEIVE